MYYSTIKVSDCQQMPVRPKKKKFARIRVKLEKS